jgi:sarcosine oxidase subunit gamma
VWPRTSPLAAAFAATRARFGEVAGMRVALAVPGAPGQVRVADASCFARAGVKGPNAAAWLAEQGIAPPPQPNTWIAAAGGLVARLGESEFLLEDGYIAGAAAALRAQPPRGVAGVYAVPRQDASLLVAGPEAGAALAEVCSFNFSRPDLPPGLLALTRVADVSALVIPLSLAGSRAFRLWCDPSYGPYLLDCLLEVAEDLGGGAAGLADLLPLPDPS